MKEGIQVLTFESHVAMQANRTVFELSQLKRRLINGSDLGQRENPLEGARENLRFMTGIVPIFEGYFELTGRRFDLGHPSISLAGASAIFYDPELGSLAYAFAPGRRPAVLSDDILNRIYNAGINPTVVETFGSLSREQLVDEVILAIKHPTLKGIRDSLRRATHVV